MGRIGVVVVSHDTKDDALACLASLRGAGAGETVLVDAGSADGTAEAVREAFPEVTVVEVPNVGYGRGANIGVTRTTTPYVVVANADTRFPPGSLDTLADELDSKRDVGAVGPLVRYPDGRLQPSARRLPTISEAVGHAVIGPWWPDNPWSRSYHRRDVSPHAPADVDWVSGCVVALRREAFEEVGGFDPGYFLFVEDVDLAHRLREAGWRVRFCPRAEVVHMVGTARQGRPLRMRVEHARSLDRFYGVAYRRGPGRLARPLVRVGLVAWAAVVSLRGAMERRRRG